MCESLVGIFRFYYEICHIDESYIDWVSIYLICDGIDRLSDDFLVCAKKAGLYDENKLREKAFGLK